MLPTTNTNRYGDLLEALLSPVSGIDKGKLERVQEVLNEFWLREEKYRSWIAEVGGITAEQARFRNLIEPLDVFTLNLDTDATISNVTKTYLTFDNASRLSEAYSLNSVDLSKVNVVYPGTNIQAGGIVEWTPNATGYRIFGMEGFDVNDVSVGSKKLHSFAGHNLDDNVFPFYWTLDGKVIENISYVKFWVQQSSGGNLDVKAADVILAKV